MKHFGLVGVGAWGQRYLRTIAARNDCSIVQVARSSSRPLEGTPIGDATLCDDWRSLLEAAKTGQLDGLIVATTPHNQLEVALACAKDAVPLLVEKPLGSSLGDVRRVVAERRAAKRQAAFVVDYVHLWAPAFDALRERIASSGEPIARIVSEGSNQGPFRAWSSLYDYGPHDVAMAVSLLGESSFRIERAARSASQHDPKGELFEAELVIAGVPLLVRVGNGGTKKIRRTTVLLSSGRELIYDDTKPHPHKLSDGGADVSIDETPPLDLVVSDFLRRCNACAGAQLEEETGRGSLQLSLGVAAILDAISEVVARS